MIRDDILNALINAARKEPDVVRQLFVSMAESGLHPRDSKTGLTPSDEALNFVIDKVRQQGDFDEWLVSELSYNDKDYLAELQRLGFALPIKRPNINRRHFESHHTWGDDMRWTLLIGKIMLVGILICFASGLWFTHKAGVDFSQTWNVWALHAIAALCLMIVYELVAFRDTAVFLREIADVRLGPLLQTVFKSTNFPKIVILGFGFGYLSWNPDHFAPRVSPALARGFSWSLFVLISVMMLKPAVCLLLGASGDGRSLTLLRLLRRALFPFKITHLLEGEKTGGGVNSSRTWSRDWHSQVDRLVESCPFLVIDTRFDTEFVRQEIKRWGPRRDKVVLYVVCEDMTSPVLSVVDTPFSSDSIVTPSSLQAILVRLRLNRSI